MSKKFSIEKIKSVPHGGGAVAYVRLSMLEQAVNTNALKNQIQRLKEKDVSTIITDIQTGRRDV